MPLYAYQCNKCSTTFDVLVGMSQEKSDIKCPKCGNKNVEKQFAPFRVSGSSSSKCTSCSSGNCSNCH